MTSADDYCFFVDEAIDGMVRIVRELGDDLANRRPDLPGANSPYVVLTHCLGVMDYWGGHVDNPADAELPIGRTQGGALLHLYSELAQHRGQMEISRDVLLAPWGEFATATHATPQIDSRYRTADDHDH